MDGLTFARIDTASADYPAMRALRDRVLRRPLGLVLSAHDTERDAVSELVVAYLDRRVVGCCVLTEERPGLVQLRAMAVDADLQARGVGRAVVNFAEGEARRRGATEMQLEARVVVLGFYARLGYAAEGAEFVKVGIPHRMMRKRLPAPP
jgi:GNAT superfamily N-acetyltransferase